MKLFNLFILIACFQLSIYAQLTCQSNQSGDWNNPSTWNINAIPNSADNVIVMTGHTITVNSGTANCNDLTINGSAALDLIGGSDLFVNGNWFNSGVFNAGSSLVKFAGVSAQTISGTNATNFNDLEVNNSAGVTFGYNQNIRGILQLNQGTLITSGYNFVFISDSISTASIGEIQPGADIVGDITMQRYLSSGVTGWRLLGSPVNGGTLQDWSNNFITSGFPGSTYPNFYFCSIYSYDETVAGTSDLGYVIPSGITQNVIPGTGYWAYIGPTPTTINVTGTPEKFSHSFPVTYSSSAGPTEDGWNLIANPYPSAIDWNSSAWTKTGINDAVYIWDPSLNQYSSYVNGIGVNGGTNVVTSSQAFWIQTNQNNPVLNCTESIKTGLDLSYMRPAPGSKTIIKLALSGNAAQDETAICFSPSANNTYNTSEDAIKFFSGDPLGISITSMVDSFDLAINSLSKTSYSVPLRVKVGVTGQYTITRDTNASLPLGTCIYLEDLATNTKVNIENASYSFTINDTTSAPRFILHIGFPISTEEISPSCSYKQNGQAIVNINRQGPWNVTWKNSVGNTLISHTLTSPSDTLNNLSSGAYSVIVNDNSGSCTTQLNTITISPADPLITQAVISNAICKGDSNGSVHLNVSGGQQPLLFNWSNNSNTANLNNLQPGTYTLIVTDNNGCKDTTLHQVQQISDLEVNFTASLDTILSNKSISFLNTSSGFTSLSWNFGDGSFNSFDYSCNHNFVNPGQYVIELTADDANCSAKAQKEVIVLEPLKIKSQNLEDGRVMLYGSGNSGFVRFNLELATNATIEAYTVEGKLITTREILALKNTEEVSLGDAQGIYILKVNIYGTTISKKIIK